ncbi:MAG: ABC transporter ATP-binding protein [Deltaproteobacteria bacterium]|nr:MAG: ABC transporter ATP-binding protein [Deltaproteobacteria bacterium]
MQTLLEIKNLKTVFSTARGVIKAVDGVSLILNNGETLGIVGESGCGKTMLALSVMRLIPANGQIAEGEILFNGQDLLSLPEDEMREKRGRDIAMIFQEPMTSLNPVLRIGEQIAEAIRLHQHVPAKEALSLSVRLLGEVGIPEPDRRVKDYPHQLSGGMRQRVMIAMAMSCRPQLLLADEPTTALDVTIQAQILNLISDLKEKNNMAVILITHDLGIVAEAVQKVAVMYAGKVVETSDVVKLFTRPLHPYTLGLIESRPSRCTDAKAGGAAYLKTIPGTVPSLYDLPPGCRFSERCELAEDECRVREPELMEIEKGHFVSCFISQRIVK